MNYPHLSVREIQVEDISRIARYWLSAAPDFLQSMGVDLAKMPDEAAWLEMLSAQLAQPYATKQSYATIWELDGQPVGHCNVNKIVFGQEAYMHLHLWENKDRQKGVGVAFVKKSLPYFFENLQLQNLYCEPYALNPAPNKTLEKVGFSFVKKHVTTPGMLNFEQPVNLWVFSAEQYGQGDFVKENTSE